MLPIEIRDKENGVSALASVVQWIEQGLGGGAGLIPVWGTCLGSGPGLLLEGEKQPINVSLPLPSFLSL